jgi:hypothetical protein
MKAEESINLSLFLGLEVRVLVGAQVAPRKKVSSKLKHLPKPSVNLSIEARSAKNVGRCTADIKSFSTRTAVSHQILSHVLHVERYTRAEQN